MGLWERNVVKLGWDYVVQTINIIIHYELKYKIIEIHVLKNVRRQSFIIPILSF